MIVPLLLAVALSGPAAALDWWVEDPAAEAALVEALDALWPGHPVEIRIGAPDEGAGAQIEGVWVTDGALWVASGGPPVALGDAPDPATRVALVRSWSRALPAEAPPAIELVVERTPETAPPAPPAPPAPAAPPPRSITWHAAFLGGPQRRLPAATPAFHFAGEAGLGGDWLRLSLIGSLDPAETTAAEGILLPGAEAAIRVRRAGLEIAPSLTIPLDGLASGADWRLELGVGAGARLHRAHVILEPERVDRLVLPCGSARARAWAPPSASGWRFGLGLAASYDLADGAGYAFGDERAAVRPTSLAIELGGRRAGDFTPR